jgi:HTH-type transcriptional regulator/antitoxin HigA
MELKPIRTKKDYQAALKAVNDLWNAKDGTADADRLEVLTILIERYERDHFPIPDPDPVDFLHHIMEARGLARKDLEPYIGSRARVAEVLNRVRPLSLEMIRNLSENLDIPADVLVRRYELAA